MNRSSNSAAGLVLIELLIAVAVAALIIGTILMVYVSVLNTVSLQDRWRVNSMPAAEALDSLRRDLSSLAIPYGATNPPFIAVFARNEKEKFEMCFYRACPAGTSNAWRYALSRVRYTWQATGAVAEFVLARESSSFRIPLPLLSGREEWPGIKGMEIAFYDGSIWTNQWNRAKGSNNVPRAVHIKLLTGSTSQPWLETEVFINAGRRITAQQSQ
jgi:hypothetical protein